MEVSARENVNIDEAFVLLAKQIKDKNIEQVENSPTLNREESEVENSKQKSIKLNEDINSNNKKSDSKCCS